jgi:uncharacterized repeat protein (TIGR01451 family)
VDAGTFDNYARVDATPPNAAGGAFFADDSTSNAISRMPALELTKTAGAITDVDGNGQDAGDTITYSFAIKNTGNVTLDPVTVSDPTAGTVTCPAGPLAPGATVLCSDAVYIITPAKVDNGKVDNVATATGTPPSGANVTSMDDTSTAVNQVPAISVAKSVASIADPDTNGRDAGDTITYAFTVTNTGNVSLTGISVSDPLLGTVSCAATTLAAGASTSCSAADYVLTQPDVDSGERTNNRHLPCRRGRFGERQHNHHDHPRTRDGTLQVRERRQRSGRQRTGRGRHDRLHVHGAQHRHRDAVGRQRGRPAGWRGHLPGDPRGAERIDRVRPGHLHAHADRRQRRHA